MRAEARHTDLARAAGRTLPRPWRVHALPALSTVPVRAIHRSRVCRTNGWILNKLPNMTATSRKIVPQTTLCDGVPASTPVQAFLDLASVGVSLVDLAIAGDSLIKANGLDPQKFVAAAEAYPGRNARRARRAASLVRAGVDSPMETRIRLLIFFAGLPEPQVNVIVRIAGGKWRWRFDLCYPEHKLIIEYDGRQHAYDAEQWSHDLERREWLDQDGWRILVVISDGIYRDPLRTLQRVRAALEERGARVPKSFKQEWTRHFAGRASLR
jgi:hypothetical protein